MQYLTLNNGLSMPIVGFGTWSLRGGACVRAVRTAFDCGIGLVDTASFYENEREVGRAVREAVRSGIPRESIFVETKPIPSSTSIRKGRSRNRSRNWGSNMST